MFLQVAFHHFFTKALNDVSQSIATKGLYSLEFEDGVPFTIVYVRFWKDDHLVRLRLCRFGTANKFPSGHLGVIARLLAAFSPRPDIVSCSGCPAEVVQILDKSDFADKCPQYPFRFDEHAFQTLIHKSSQGGVFGPVDFYSTLQYLIVYLGGAQQQSWLVEAPALVKVIICSFRTLGF